MAKLNVGIASCEEMKKWPAGVASGAVQPRRGAPKIWFPSLKAAANLFTDDNRQLLKIIADQRPASIAELERLSHRKSSNLSRTLKKLEQYGLVRLVEGESPTMRGRKPVRPEVLVDAVNVSFTLI